MTNKVSNPLARAHLAMYTPSEIIGATEDMLMRTSLEDYDGVFTSHRNQMTSKELVAVLTDEEVNTLLEYLA